MLLHVERDRAGRRRLGEIAVLRPTAGGLVHTSTVWHADGRPGTEGPDARDRLDRLLHRPVAP